jgi:hypothetical protein
VPIRGPLETNVCVCVHKVFLRRLFVCTNDQSSTIRDACAKYCWGDQLTMNKMRGEYGMYREEERCTEGFSGET